MLRATGSLGFTNAGEIFDNRVNGFLEYREGNKYSSLASEFFGLGG